MKIVHVIEGLDDSYGGPSKSVPYMAYYCSLHGAEPHLLSTNYTGADSNEIIADKGLAWQVFDTAGPAKLRYSVRLRDRLFEIGAADRGSTIVHVHNLWNYTSYAAFKACQAHGMPLVVSPRGSLFTWSLSQGRTRKKMAWTMFQKKVLNASVLHTTSDEEAHAVAKLGVGKRIFRVRNGVELNPGERQGIGAADAVPMLGLDPGRRHALFMSRLHKKKGLELLFEAWADCPARSEWRLLIAGDTTDTGYLKALKSRVATLGLNDSVQFVGFADANKRALLFAASDLFVLPSFSENFGIVVAEALASGVPVITTVGTPWADLATKKAGWYIDIDRQALSGALSEAMRLSPEELKQMGGNGRRLAVRYDWNDIGKEMVGIYQQILAKAKITG